MGRLSLKNKNQTLCELHPNWSKWHPNETCCVCYWDKKKNDIIKNHPHWSDRQIEQKLESLI